MKLKNASYTALAAAVALVSGSALAGPLHRNKAAAEAQGTQQHAEANLSGNPAHDRQQLEKMATQTIEQLRQKNQNAAQALDQAYGVAVFDATKGGLIVTGVGGTGVAMPTSALPSPTANNETFMHVGGAGVGLAAGLSNYKLIMLFKDRDTYRQFVNGQWSGGSSAQASAGKAGATAEASWHNGVEVYRMTDGGLIAGVDISGMKFWPSDKLNRGNA